MAKKNKITAAAKRVAEECNLTPISRSKAIKLMKECRAKRIDNGLLDRCSDVARMLNEAGVVRDWYTSGEPTFDAWSVRGAWVKQYGSWAAGCKRRKKPKKGSLVPKVGTGLGTPVYTLGVVSKEAEQFCAGNELWHPITGDQLIVAVRSLIRLGKPGNKIVDRLNENHRLRHNYKRGLPRWTLQELSRTVKLVNGGQGLKSIKDQITMGQGAAAREDKEAWDHGSVPRGKPATVLSKKSGRFAVNKNRHVALRSTDHSSTKEEIFLQEIHQDGTCTIGVTRLVEQYSTETVSLQDPRVISALQDRLNNK